MQPRTDIINKHKEGSPFKVGNASSNPGDFEPEYPIDYIGKDPHHAEVRIAIASLKNNKAPGEAGLPTDQLKFGDEELKKCIYKLFFKNIWSKCT